MKFEGGIKPSPTSEYEIHYAFDVRTEPRETEPLKLHDLLDDTARFLRVGGWFLFDGPDDCRPSDLWRYRSNQFLPRLGADEQRLIRGQYDFLAGYLSRRARIKGYTFSLRVLVEKVLGIYKDTAANSEPRELDSLDQIAEWERQGQWHNFWVVAPNFAGDLDSNIEAAMKKNLLAGTRYTYFLQSKVDVRRLERFARQRLGGTKRIEAVMLSPFHVADELRDGLRDRWFIGFAGDTLEPWVAEGYRLERNESRDIIGAQPLEMPIRSWLIAELKPLVAAGRTQCHCVPLVRQQLGKFAVLCTDIVDSRKLRKKVVDWEALIDEYDDTVSDTVSKCGGYMGRELLDGYILAVPDENALRCAKLIHHAAARLFENQNLSNPHRVALDGVRCS